VNPEAQSDDPTYKVKLQSDDVSNLLKNIADGAGPDLSPGIGGTRYRIVHAYKKCADFLEESIGPDSELLAQYFEYVWRQTSLIAIETADLQAAYRIFQTLNDRGATLLASDLLKSLLFRTAANDKVAQKAVAAEWSAVISAMQEAGESNHVRFLRYFFMADYETNGLLRADTLFDWLIRSAPEALKKELKKPATFARRLRSAADDYAAFSSGLDKSGKVQLSLSAITQQGSGVKQHLCILLAGRSLKKDAFEALTLALETLTMTFILSKERWNVLEKLLPDWCALIREAELATDQQSAIDEFIHKEIRPLIDEHAERMWERLDDTQPDPKKLIETILARIAFFVQREAKLPGSWTTLFEPEMTLEHILPQSLKEANLEEFGVGDIDEGSRYVYRLGNLALMPWGKNSAMSDRTWATFPAGAAKGYEPKKAAFKNSDWLLFSALGDDKLYGKRGATNIVIDKYDLREASVWNVDAFLRRQMALETIAADVWPMLPSRPGIS
jgi:hypothetical protein